MNLLLRTITLLFWVLAVLVWWEGYQVFFLEWIPKVALVVLGIHVVEVAVYWMFFRAKSRYPRLDALAILVFGVFHMHKFFRKEQRVAGF